MDKITQARQEYVNRAIVSSQISHDWHIDLMPSFGERLLETFNYASMADIARQLDVSHSTVRNYVQQNRLPDADVLIKIVNRTNVSLRWLLAGVGDSNAEDDSLRDLGGRIEPEQIASIEALRIEWARVYEHKVSWNDFLVILITHGETAVRRKLFGNDVEVIRSIVREELAKAPREWKNRPAIEEGPNQSEIGPMEPAEMIWTPKMTPVGDDEGRKKKRKTG